MTIKLRYKKPDQDTSRLLTQTLQDKSRNLQQTTANFRFAAAVAEFGMLLRDSEFKGTASYRNVLKLAKGAKGEDEHGYQGEFIQLVRKVDLLAMN